MAAPGARAEIVDGLAAIVGTSALTLSDVDAELGIAALLERRPLDARPERRREALARLIERQLVLEDLALVPFLAAQPDEVEGNLERLRAERYLDGLDFDAALRHYGVTERALRNFLAAGLGLERFVAFRFKTGLDPGQEALEAYYRDEYAPRRREQGESVEPLEAVARQIARILVERRANELLEERLKELRALHRVEILAGSSEGEGP